MNVPLQLLRRLSADRAVLVVVGTVVAVVTTVLAVAGLASTVDGDVLNRAWTAATNDPLTGALAAAAFLGAFVVRGAVWARMTPHLGIGHAVAGVLVATGANHVLPFRLGEPLRVASVVRRAGLRIDDATSSTVVLRLGDVAVLLGLGVVLAPTVLVDVLGWWVVPVAAAMVASAGLLWPWLRSGLAAGRLRRPDAITLAGTTAVWLLEAVLVWQVAAWAGASIGPRDAVLVGVVAVVAQLVAVAPGGLGTYEAAATAALVVVGVPAEVAVSVALTVHAAKTVLTVGAGVIALFVPSPSLLGRFRLPRRRPVRPATPAPEGPVVLFLPAYHEEPRIAAVIRRAPSQVCGRAVEVVVVDDGSTDATADVARRAGARVVAHDRNRGLGAAVATGFADAVAHGAAAVAFCDADGEYDPAELETLVAPILAGTADYVVGSRFAGQIEAMKPHRRVGNLVLTGWVRMMARVPITDGQSGYRALSRAAATEARMAHDYNYAQVLTLDLVARGFGYHEVGITYHHRTSGESFVKLGRYLRRCVPAAWRVVNGRTLEPASPRP